MSIVKKIIIYIVITILVIIGGAVGFVIWSLAASKTSTVGEITFENSLKIPELLEFELDSEGRKVFDLTFNQGEVEFLKGKLTETWGLNDPYLSPTIRASNGDSVVVNVTNKVGEKTTLHWHGMLLPSEMDGGPHQMIYPGETWSPQWKVNQPASTTWFHPHLHGETEDHVYRGAAGMFIVDDENSKSLELPKEYGVNDIPLIIQDKNFNNDGSLSTGSKMFSNVGILGDEILVNGTHSPYFEATTNLVRFRVLNASTARVYNFSLDDNRSFHMIATDSGLLESPVELEELMLSPGERAEIVVEVVPGETVILQSKDPNLGAPFWGERYNGGDDEFDILEIRANQKLTQLPDLPEKLATIKLPNKDEVVETRYFELNGYDRINGQEMDMNRVDHVITAGSTEIWEVSNPREEMYHNFHVHGIHFEVLEVNGEKAPAHMRGLKDTVYLAPNSKVKLIARFETYSDANYPYMYHCHILLHEDMGMMGQFLVVEPGANPSRELKGHDRHRH
ncbi:multicopper oxidase domain-containing protein [Bacillus luteolus]|uniref:Multicopper oxidase domain-containing protein n=1 Tax=Litchfieldia luteola TaxID=682179 RepID=A0ABR9QL57_9BACI|nr:multicopper oxidase domain-containing protein [Cytobacillus luteolus]MBE4909236.1 multicopper oxidase domain-containing protein [Cytobacillus luteolus]MBP1940307.1 FtsP/CotA-like multicopper oxidase with cupredoxin domain [Cytobacillus luteolus]